MKPRLIVVEGGDGLGKSSLANRLADWKGVTVTVAPSRDNSLRFLRDVVKSDGLEPFERQCLVALSIIVDFYEKFESCISDIVTDRSTLSTMIYGTCDGVPAEKMAILMKAFNQVTSRWSRQFDVDILILDRDQRFGKADDSYQEQNINWNFIQQGYRDFAVADPVERVTLFSHQEKVHLLPVNDLSFDQVYEKAREILG